jgi:agmatine/peptidylarginine deiminase
MNQPALRFPAEWEPQSAVLVAWPHAGTDWAGRLADVEETYIALVAAITRFQRVLVCVADDDVETYAEMRLRSNRVDMDRVRFVTVPYDDTWLRDSGPITLVAEDGPQATPSPPGRESMPMQRADEAGAAFRLLDFRFTGWGGKYEGGRDDRLVETLHARGLFGHATHRRIDWALEGGAIEVDGKGSLLTTWRCLHQRHPQMSRTEMDALLRDAFAVERVLWLEHGYLEGDDTDAHIDTLARYAPDDAIVLQTCDDPADPHHAELSRMREEIAALRTLDGRPYRLHELPWARAIVDGGRRLAASYANYLVVDGGVVMPAYGDPSDATAARVIAAAHPGREVVAVDARELIWQNGSVHCLTMQLPAGVFAG